MQITNTTTLAKPFIRRLVAWCRGELGLPAKHLRQVDFRNRSDKWVCGRAYWSGRIIVRIGTAPDCPLDWTHRTIKVHCPDRMAAIIFVTAHEIQHIVNYTDGTDRQLRRARDLEPHCDRAGNRVMKRFLERRDELLAEWNVADAPAETPAAEPAPMRSAALAPDPAAKRAAKAVVVERFLAADANS